MSSFSSASFLPHRSAFFISISRSLLTCFLLPVPSTLVFQPLMQGNALLRPLYPAEENPKTIKLTGLMSYFPYRADPYIESWRADRTDRHEGKQILATVCLSCPYASSHTMRLFVLSFSVLLFEVLSYADIDFSWPVAFSPLIIHLRYFQVRCVKGALLYPKSENERTKIHLGTFTFLPPNSVGEPYAPESSRIPARHRGMQMGSRFFVITYTPLRARIQCRVCRIYIQRI